LLQTNVDNLTYDDAYNIANKLMVIIVNIEDWSKSLSCNFESDQVTLLKEYTFKLTVKFMILLNSDFCLDQWQTFEPIWVESIDNWDPLAFKTLSTFFIHNNSESYLVYGNKMAVHITNSFKRSKNKLEVLVLLSNIDYIDAILNLIHLYNCNMSMDILVSTSKSDVDYFIKYIGPLIEMIRLCFKIQFQDEKKLLNFVHFYLNFFESSAVKMVKRSKDSSNIWDKHLEVIVAKFEFIIHNSVVLSNNVKYSMIQVIKCLTTFFNEDKVNEYSATVNSAIVWFESKN
jgi:hypothetical protein